MGEGDKGVSHAGDRPVAGVSANVASFAAASAGDALAKLAVSSLPLPQTIVVRSLLSLLLFTPLFVMSARRGEPVFATSRPWLNLTRTMLHLASTFLGLTALKNIPLTTFTAIVFVSPLFIALLAIPILGERIRPHQWIAIALGFAGCMIIIRPSGDGPLLFTLMALGSALTWAVSVTILRLLTRTESRVTLLAWGNIPQLLVVALIAPFDWRPIEPPLLLIILGMAVMQFLGQWFSMTALRLAPAATVAPAQFTQILWATLLGVLFFNEWPHPVTWIGAALIMAGGWWLMRADRAAS